MDDAVTQAFFDVARDKLREGETISEHFPLPQPYREDYHQVWPIGGPIPRENHANLLHSSAVEPGDNDVERGKVLKTVRRIFEGLTKREVKEAKLARTLQSPRVGNMCDAKLKHMVSVNGLSKECSHTFALNM